MALNMENCKEYNATGISYIFTLAHYISFSIPLFCFLFFSLLFYLSLYLLYCNLVFLYIGHKSVNVVYFISPILVKIHAYILTFAYTHLKVKSLCRFPQIENCCSVFKPLNIFSRSLETCSKFLT